MRIAPAIVILGVSSSLLCSAASPAAPTEPASPTACAGWRVSEFPQGTRYRTVVLHMKKAGKEASVRSVEDFVLVPFHRKFAGGDVAGTYRFWKPGGWILTDQAASFRTTADLAVAAEKYLIQQWGDPLLPRRMMSSPTEAINAQTAGKAAGVAAGSSVFEMLLGGAIFGSLAKEFVAIAEGVDWESAECRARARLLVVSSAAWPEGSRLVTVAVSAIGASEKEVLPEDLEAVRQILRPPLVTPATDAPGSPPDPATGPDGSSRQE